MTRTRLGAALTAAGAIGLPIAMLANWFAEPYATGWTAYEPLHYSPHESAWRALDAPIVVLAVIAIAVGLVWAALAAARPGAARPTPASS